MVKRNLQHEEEVSVKFTKREMDLIINETFVDDTYLLSAEKSGTKLIVKLDYGDIEDIIGHVAASANHAPNKILQKMETDLATLPLFLAKSDDCVIVDKIPSILFINSLKKLGINLPHFITKKEVKLNQKFTSLKRDKLIPWGWSPAVHKILSPLKASCSEEFKNSPVFNWQQEHRDLYSKKFASAILKTLLYEYSNEHFIPKNQLTEVCTTQQEIEKLLKKWGKLMIKAPWSSSGRGLQPIIKSFMHQKVWAKLLGIVKEQGYAIVEPYLDKVFDLAFIFELKKGKVIFRGTSYFTTDKKGQYIGNSLNGLLDEVDKTVRNFVETVPAKIIQPLIRTIESSDLAKYYEGFFGVDTLIYNDENGTLKINPCLEINVRQNMGLLSLRLEKLIHPDKKGIYRIFYKPGTTFYQFKKDMEKKYPLKVSNGKIESGFLPLVDASQATLFGAYVLV